MAVKKTNSRVTITLTKKQLIWIKKQAKAKSLSVSQFVSWLLVAKANEIKDYLDLNINSFDELKTIVQAKWLD